VLQITNGLLAPLVIRKTFLLRVLRWHLVGARRRRHLISLRWHRLAHVQLLSSVSVDYPDEAVSILEGMTAQRLGITELEGDFAL
jgi:hypothetical protein